MGNKKYTEKIKTEARLRWLKGETLEKIAQDDYMPDVRTLYNWKAKQNWDADLEAIYAKAREYQDEMISKEIAEMNERHLRLSAGFMANITHHLSQRDEKGPKFLDSDELDRLSRTMERITKIERVARELPSDRQQIGVDISEAWMEFLKNARGD